MSSKRIREVFEQGQGVLQLVPTWVPRSFNEPGRRLRLHPDDYYAFGLDRGGICERWIGSVTVALNGPKTGPTEGMSFVLADPEQNEQILFADFVEELGADLIGPGLFEKYGTWPTFAKLFDYDKPLFHHLHLTEEKANKIGRHGKPEAYYFPHQYNAYLGRFPVTYFGFDPSTDPEDIKECIRNFAKFDTRITQYSRAYRIELGTGWYTPAGVIHAPGSVVTYEPQWNSDVNTIMENVTMGEINPPNMLTDCTPEEEKNDVEAIFSQIDWEESTRPDYKAKYFRRPIEAPNPKGSDGKMGRLCPQWSRGKGSDRGTGSNGEACGSGLLRRFGGPGLCPVRPYHCEAPIMLRFGQPSGDEFFVSEKAAKEAS